MRALITGVTGFLGSGLARRLTERGDRVRGLFRTSSDASGLAGVPLERVQGEVGDVSALVAGMEGMDVVFHLAGIRRAPDAEGFRRVNAEGTRSVCDAMVRAAGPRRLVLCGSLAASGPSSPDRPRVETDDFRPAEAYGESKAEAERIAFSYSGDLEVTVARPPRILGPGDAENLVFFKLVKRGLKVVIGGGPRPLSLVDVEDVVDLLLLLAERREAVGEAFFATSPETATLEEVQDQAAAALGVRPRVLHLPPALLRGLAMAADGVSRATGRHLPLNRKLARQLLAPAWTCSPEKAQRVLGFRAVRSLSSSIARSAAWYRQQGWL